MGVPVAEIEASTGLSKDVIRKWEARYGFPQPSRDRNGERLYPVDQVASLRLIRRLLDAGMRPSKVVGLPRGALERLAEEVSLAGPGEDDGFHAQVLAALRNHDPEGLARVLHQQMSRRGIISFVQDDLARMNIAVGDAWLRGDVKVFQEHLYSEAVQEMLALAAATLPPGAGSPRILLTTPPGELHGLGITMAKVVLRLNGAACITLGPQTPVPEICEAVEKLAIDVVGLSISIGFPARKAVAFLKELAGGLRPQTAIWAGGLGAVRLPARLPRVVRTASFEAALAALAAMRSKT